MSNAIQRLNKGQNLPKKLNQKDTGFKKIENDISALSIPFKTFAAVGELDRYQYAGRSLRSNTANAASTIVMPAVAGGRWYATVHYSARAAG